MSATGTPLRQSKHRGEYGVLNDDESRDGDESGESPLATGWPVKGIEAGPGNQSRADEIRDVEDHDVPAGTGAHRLGHERDRDRDRRERWGQDENCREDRGKREMRPLVLLPLGTHEVDGADNREQHDERQPLLVLYAVRQADERGRGDRDPHDRELEGRRSRTDAGRDALERLPHFLGLIVVQDVVLGITRFGDGNGAFRPSKG